MEVMFRIDGVWTPAQMWSDGVWGWRNTQPGRAARVDAVTLDRGPHSALTRTCYRSEVATLLEGERVVLHPAKARELERSGRANTGRTHGHGHHSPSDVWY
jgi:hypothetical protein